MVNMASSSWERYADASIEDLATQFRTRLTITDEQRERWSTNEFNIFLTLLCYDILHPRTRVVEIIEHVLYHSIMVSLDIFFAPGMFDGVPTDLLVNLAIGRGFSSLTLSLQPRLVEEYKSVWHAAEVIQQAWFAYRSRPAMVIQKAWRKAISDPRHLLCRKRLANEFLELLV